MGNGHMGEPPPRRTPVKTLPSRNLLGKQLVFRQKNAPPIRSQSSDFVQAPYSDDKSFRSKEKVRLKSSKKR